MGRAQCLDNWPLSVQSPLGPTHCLGQRGWSDANLGPGQGSQGSDDCQVLHTCQVSQRLRSQQQRLRSKK